MKNLILQAEHPIPFSDREKTVMIQEKMMKGDPMRPTTPIKR
jgi:hypothetical protein